MLVNMRKNLKNDCFMGVLATSLLFASGCSAQNKLHPYAKTNHLQANNAASVNHNTANYSLRYGAANQIQNPQIHGPQIHGPQIRGTQNTRGRYAKKTQNYAPPPGPMDMFQRWVDFEPQYTLYPGDQIDIVVQSAPELSRTLTVGPAGRITMPMASPIMAAGKSIPYIQAALSVELAKQLRDPTVAVTSRAFGPQQIYVGGQVGQQGTYAMSGPIGSLEAIIMAGGFLPSAKSNDVAILRRAPNGGWMIRTINHKNGMQNIRSYADNMQLKRGDVIFVPRNALSEVGVFMQAFRAALPIDLSLSYNLGNNFSAN